MERTSQFYAAGKLIYDHKGEPLELKRLAQLDSMVQDNPVLVLSDVDKVQKLKVLDDVLVRPIADNGKIALVFVRQRPSSLGNFGK